MEKVIPPGLNYADIKPEAIENQIRMVRILPQSNIRDQKANDVIRFHLQGNGFYDPYSAYIKIRVSNYGDIPDPAGDVADRGTNQISGKFLDRSAHSFINRLVIRSQGTELERIEQYDVMAAMVNDMAYSSEQRLLHHYEGFSYKSLNQTKFDYDRPVTAQSLQALSLLNADGPCTQNAHYGDRGFFKMLLPPAVGADGEKLKQYNGTDPVGLTTNGVPITKNDFMTYNPAAGSYVAVARPGEGVAAGIYTSPQMMEFCIPIYSGIIGVMMPDKKLLPLSLLPLEVEFTLNPHAFYPVGNCTERGYKIETFEIWTHTLFFEQELHRSLESVVAEAGIFIHYNSFYLTPINTYNNQTISKFHQLGCYLKSVEAIHWVFLYTNGYTNPNGTRKLHFVSHNLSNLQLRNGMDLIPSEPIPAKVGGSQFGPAAIQGGHGQMLIETYKGWNKMHDPLSDGAITPFNYQIDAPLLVKPVTFEEFFTQQKVVGRCQYALSLVGEELGQNPTIVCGKKSVMPFDLNFDAFKSNDGPSIMLSFLRADFIVYVRPDLIVTRLGI